MDERVCRACGYHITSRVVEACPQCGAALPPRLGSGGRLLFGAAGVLLAFGVAGGILFGRGGRLFGPASDPSTEPPTTPAAACASDGTQARVIESAASLETAAVVPLMGHADPSVRKAAAEALGKRDRSASAALASGLADRCEYVRRASAEGLGAILDASRFVVAPTDEELPERPAAVKTLTAALKDGFYGVRGEAAAALGRIGDTSAGPALLATLGDPDDSVRGAAVAALGSLRDRRAVAPLLDLVRDEAFRWRAAEALGEIEGPRAEGLLLAAATRRDYALMAGAHDFYIRRGPDFDDVVLALAADANDVAIRSAMAASGHPRLATAADFKVPALPAGGGRPGQAYAAYLAAVQGLRRDRILAAVAREYAPAFDGVDLARLARARPRLVTFVCGTVNGGDAVIVARGDMGGYASRGRTEMVEEDGRWKVRRERWR